MSSTLGFDIGIKNLAYCKIDNVTHMPTDFNKHSLIDNHTCDYCKLVVRYISTNVRDISVCNNHYTVFTNTPLEWHAYDNKDKITCFSCKTRAKHHNKEYDMYSCNKHVMPTIDKLYKFKKIKTTSKVTVTDVTMPLYTYMDNLVDSGVFDDVSNIVIETQLAHVNPTMAQLSILLYAYAVLKLPDINVKFVSATGKFTVNGIEMTVGHGKENKKQCVNLFKTLLNEEQTRLFKSLNKHDDVADAYCMALKSLS